MIVTVITFKEIIQTCTNKKYLNNLKNYIRLGYVFNSKHHLAIAASFIATFTGVVLQLTAGFINSFLTLSLYLIANSKSESTIESPNK